MYRRTRRTETLNRQSGVCIYSNPKRTYNIIHYQTVYCSSHRITPPHVQFVRIMYHNILLWRVCRVSWTTHIRYTGKIKKAPNPLSGRNSHILYSYTLHHIIRNIADTVIYYMYIFIALIYMYMYIYIYITRTMPREPHTNNDIIIYTQEKCVYGIVL